VPGAQLLFCDCVLPLRIAAWRRISVAFRLKSPIIQLYKKILAVNLSCDDSLRHTRECGCSIYVYMYIRVDVCYREGMCTLGRNNESTLVAPRDSWLTLVDDQARCPRKSTKRVIQWMMTGWEYKTIEWTSTEMRDKQGTGFLLRTGASRVNATDADFLDSRTD